MKKMIIFLWALTMPGFLSSQSSFKVDGINYTVTSEQTVQVSGNGGAYQGSVTVPSTVRYEQTDYRVCTVEPMAFASCPGLEVVSLPSSVKTLEKSTFQYSKMLRKVELPDSLKNIPDFCFLSCSALDSVNLPASVRAIGLNAFFLCTSLTNLNFPDSLNFIGDAAFSNCGKLLSLDLPNGLTRIPVSLCQNSVLLNKLSLPEGITEIAKNAFSGCHSLTGVRLPSTLLKLSDQAFYRCTALNTIAIPSHAYSIGSMCFGFCTSLKNVNLPAKLTELGSYAFYGSNSISGIRVYAEEPSRVNVGNKALPADLSKIKLEVPASSLTAYSTLSPWSGFGQLAVIQTSQNDYFMSNASGYFDDKTTWKSSNDELNWLPADICPEEWACSVLLKSGNELIVRRLHVLDRVKIEEDAVLYLAPGAMLTLQDTLRSNGTMTLKDGSSFICPATTGGRYRFGRDFPGNQAGTGREWWYLSSPVSDASAEGFDSGGLNNFGYFDESANPPAFVKLNDSPYVLEQGRGYLAQIRANGSFFFEGPALNSGTICIQPTRSGNSDPGRGFNLIGNPYPSSIDWHLVFNSPETVNISPTLWYRTHAGNNNIMEFRTYNTALGLGLKGASAIIPPMQGFWIRVENDGSHGSISFTNDVRLHELSSSNSLKTASENGLKLNDPNQVTVPALNKDLAGFSAGSDGLPAGTDDYAAGNADLFQYIRLEITNGTYADELLLVGNPGFSEGRDEYDSPKLTNSSPDIPEIYILPDATVSSAYPSMNAEETEEYAIASFPGLSGRTFPLGIRSGRSGIFKIAMIQDACLRVDTNQDLRVQLRDRLTGENVELNAEAYEFYADGHPEPKRFVLEVKQHLINGLHESEDSDREADLFRAFYAESNKIHLIFNPAPCLVGNIKEALTENRFTGSRAKARKIEILDLYGRILYSKCHCEDEIVLELPVKPGSCLIRCNGQVKKLFM